MEKEKPELKIENPIPLQKANRQMPSIGCTRQKAWGLPNMVLGGFPFRNLIRGFLTLCLLLLLNGCTVVKQWQREHLSDPTMQLDEDSEAQEMEQHLLERREGSSGGHTASGGGCGC